MVQFVISLDGDDFTTTMEDPHWLAKSLVPGLLAPLLEDLRLQRRDPSFSTRNLVLVRVAGMQCALTGPQAKTSGVGAYASINSFLPGRSQPIRVEIQLDRNAISPSAASTALLKTVVRAKDRFLARILPSRSRSASRVQTQPLPVPTSSSATQNPAATGHSTVAVSAGNSSSRPSFGTGAELSPGFHVTSIVVPMSEITLGRQIGVGTTKAVFEATRNGQKIAVLRVRRAPNSTAKESLGLPWEAAAFLRIGHHPHVVKMLGVGQSLSAPATAETADDITTLLTELAPLGSLDALLEAEGVRATLTPQTALEILQQVASGAAHIAAGGFAHADISLRNILVFKFPGRSGGGGPAVGDAGEGWDRLSGPPSVLVKLNDLAGAVSIRRRAAHNQGVRPIVDGQEAFEGLASAQRRETACVPNATVAVRYAPPEVLEHRTFSTASDVWSYAVCAWEVFSDEAMPYISINSDEEVSQAVCAGMRLQRPSRCPPILWPILTQCWEKNPVHRPSFEELLQQMDVVVALQTNRATATTVDETEMEDGNLTTAADVLRRMGEISGKPPAERLSRNQGDHDLAMLAHESLEIHTMPEGVSEEMRLEHYRSKWELRRRPGLNPNEVPSPRLPDPAPPTSRPEPRALEVVVTKPTANARLGVTLTPRTEGCPVVAYIQDDQCLVRGLLQLGDEIESINDRRLFGPDAEKDAAALLRVTNGEVRFKILRYDIIPLDVLELLNEDEAVLYAQLDEAARLRRALESLPEV